MHRPRAVAHSWCHQAAHVCSCPPAEPSNPFMCRKALLLRCRPVRHRLASGAPKSARASATVPEVADSNFVQYSAKCSTKNNFCYHTVLLQDCGRGSTPSTGHEPSTSNRSQLALLQMNLFLAPKAYLYMYSAYLLLLCAGVESKVSPVSSNKW